MKQLLQSKAIWQTLAKNQPMFTKEMEKFAYRNKLDEAMGLFGIHVSNSLMFHLHEWDTPKKRWDKLSSLFDKINEFKALKLEVEVSSLVPDEHASIEDYLSKLWSFLAQFKGWEKKKSNNECISSSSPISRDPMRYFFHILFNYGFPWRWF